MPLNIVTALEPITVEHLITVIYGDPGIGKTSLAFSAKNPILFDFDQGAHRAGVYRKDTVQISKWSEVSSFSAQDLDGYDTVIVDTGGRCLDMITAELVNDAKNTRRGSKELSIQGYGALARTFTNWLKLLRSFGKDIIILAHASEDKNGDSITHRPDMVGGAKKEIYKTADLMAYMTSETVSGYDAPVHVLKFPPSNDYHGKDSGGLGVVVLQDLEQCPDQMAGLLERSKTHINALSAEAVQSQKEVDDFRASLLDASTADELNKLGETIKAHPRRRTMLADLKNRGTALGFTSDKSGFHEVEAASA